MAERLQQAGLPTLDALARRINHAGARWWYPVRGLGATKAARVTQWLCKHQASTGLVIVTAVPSDANQHRGALSQSTTVPADFAWIPSSKPLRKPSSLSA